MNKNRNCVIFHYRFNTIYVQVSICNVIRGVMEGKALVSLLADILDEADNNTVDFLLMVSTCVLKNWIVKIKQDFTALLLVKHSYIKIPSNQFIFNPFDMT